MKHLKADEYTKMAVGCESTDMEHRACECWILGGDCDFLEEWLNEVDCGSMGMQGPLYMMTLQRLLRDGFLSDVVSAGRVPPEQIAAADSML